MVGEFCRQTSYSSEEMELLLHVWLTIISSNDPEEASVLLQFLTSNNRNPIGQIESFSFFLLLLSFKKNDKETKENQSKLVATSWSSESPQVLSVFLQCGPM